MSHSPAQSLSSTTSGTTAPSPKQEALINYCRQNGIRAPSFQVVSDRRGGRTAWSCIAQVGGQYIHARYWYDGQYVNSAREDAAEMALQSLGQMPTPPGQTRTYQQQQQQQQNNQQPQQRPQQQYSAWGNGIGSHS
ncbi:Hypothetical protein R9X50_00223900 [Acrodontium crateriforme]|uniref:DRBM domain-containing protein n=1 Tax=Acrodontium crateriforme TaxID=150365 RepID=A0AAQ3M3W1_9PEZI|nr:Hypothetical protein R9X50_00223900 [Acrodontium crateriforme]